MLTEREIRACLKTQSAGPAKDAMRWVLEDTTRAPCSLDVIEGEIKQEQMLVAYWSEDAELTVVLVPHSGSILDYARRIGVLEYQGAKAGTLAEVLGLLGSGLEDHAKGADDA